MSESTVYFSNSRWRCHAGKVVLLLLLCCLLSPLIARAQETPLPQPSGVVARCFDGDTLKLTDRRIVRLAGIDAPEVAHDGGKAQFYARQSREELDRLAKAERCTCLPQVSTAGTGTVALWPMCVWRTASP